MSIVKREERATILVEKIEGKRESMTRKGCEIQIDIRKALDQGEFMFDLSTLLLAVILGLLKLGFSSVFFESHLYKTQVNSMLANPREKMLDCWGCSYRSCHARYSFRWI